MKHLAKFLTLIILFTTLGCGQKSGNANTEMTIEDVVEPATSVKQKTPETIERKLIKEGHIMFETDNLNATRKSIFEAVKKYKAYISSDQEYKSPGRKSNTIIIRVPADNFDNLLRDATKGVKKFERKDITVKDVTEEFLDVQARLKTKKELEQRYLELLKDAKNVTEVLEIEKQIGQLRSDIESIEGHLKLLQNSVSFSTLTINFYERIPNNVQFGQKFKTGFKNGWDNLIWFFVFLVNIWPFIFLIIGIFFGIRMYRNRKR